MRVTLTRTVTYQRSVEWEVDIPDEVVERERITEEAPWPVQDHVDGLIRNRAIHEDSGKKGEESWVSTDWKVNRVGADDEQSIAEWNY